MKYLPLMLLGVTLLGCAGIPKNVVPVENFDVNRYLGTWYEIARFDHSFERGLSRVTATYSLNENGTIRVVNRGFKAEKNEWKEAIGKAKFVGRQDVGRLKVSFFGPFYGGYNIIDLDAAYSRVLVCSSNDKYLWILAREPKLPDEVLKGLLDKANSLGFATEKLIYVEH